MEVVYYIPRYYVSSNGHFTHRSNFYEGDVIIGKSLETKFDGKSKRSINASCTHVLSYAARSSCYFLLRLTPNLILASRRFIFVSLQTARRLWPPLNFR